MKSPSWSRRSFLRTVGAAGAVAFSWNAANLERVEAASQSVAGRSPEDVAQDEFYWREVQLGFRLDRSLINLNNGFTAPMPRVVIESVFRYMDMINMLPVHYQGMVAGNAETIRRRMANEFGCDIEEMALTRGASEALQIAINGLDLKAGDEVVTTDQDYPRFLNSWKQRQQREGIVLRQVDLPPPPVPLDEFYNRLVAAVTPKTKVIMVCHMTHWTAQMAPMKRIAEMNK